MSSIKFLINGEVRRVSVPDDKSSLTYQALIEILTNLVSSLRGKKFSLTWLDDEGDSVTVSSDYELLEAIKVMSDAGSVLKFTVVEVPTIDIPAEPALLTSPFDDVVHEGVICDDCGMNPITGIRYKCTVRKDYDVCQTCEAKNPQPYPMIKITNPSQAPVGIVYAFNDMPEEPNVRPPAWCGRPNRPLRGPFVDPHGPPHGPPHGHPQGHPHGHPHGPHGHPHGPHGHPQGPHNRPPHHGPPHLGGPPHGHRGHPLHGPSPFGPRRCPFSAAASTVPVATAETKECNRMEKKAEKLTKKLEKVNEKLASWTCPPAKFMTAMDEILFGSCTPKESDSSKSNQVNEATDEQLSAAIQASLETQRVEEEVRRSADFVATVPSSVPTLPKPALRFVRDVTFTDGTYVPSGSTFKKVWRVRNDGKYAWPEGCVLATAGGDMLCDPDVKQPLPVVNPEEETEISIDLKAPTAPGLYTSYFRAQTKEEQKFGHRLWVSIVSVEEGEWDVVTSASDLNSVEESQAAPEGNVAAKADDVPNEDNDTAPSAEPLAEEQPVASSDATVPVESAPVVEDAAQAPTQAPVRTEEVQQQSFVLLWRRELEILADMGFTDLEVITPLLQMHLGSPVSLTSGSPNSEGMQRVIIALLNQ